MIGLVVTGHGHFATGLTSSVNLIAGPQKDYVAVDFDGEGTEKLEADLKAAFETLKDSEGIIVFSDLAGGSPYKTAAMIGVTNPKIKVLSGTNLPMLVEVSMARTMIDDLDALVSTAINAGKDNIEAFELPDFDNGPAEGEEGI